MSMTPPGTVGPATALLSAPGGATSTPSTAPTAPSSATPVYAGTVMVKETAMQMYTRVGWVPCRASNPAAAFPSTLQHGMGGCFKARVTLRLTPRTLYVFDRTYWPRQFFDLTRPFEVDFNGEDPAAATVFRIRAFLVGSEEKDICAVFETSSGDSKDNSGSAAAWVEALRKVGSDFQRRIRGGADGFDLLDYDLGEGAANPLTGEIRNADVLCSILLYLPLDRQVLSTCGKVCKGWRFFVFYLPHWRVLTGLPPPAAFSNTVGGQPRQVTQAVASYAYGIRQPQSIHSGIFGCFSDCRLCIDVAVCGCLRFSIGTRPEVQEPKNLWSTKNWCMNCCLAMPPFCLVTFPGFLHSYEISVKGADSMVANWFGLPKHSMLSNCCCGFCVYCRAQREFKLRTGEYLDPLLLPCFRSHSPLDLPLREVESLPVAFGPTPSSSEDRLETVGPAGRRGPMRKTFLLDIERPMMRFYCVIWRGIEAYEKSVDSDI